MPLIWLAAALSPSSLNTNCLAATFTPTTRDHPRRQNMTGTGDTESGKSGVYVRPGQAIRELSDISACETDLAA
jgi:hypothetical protein